MILKTYFFLNHSWIDILSISSEMGPWWVPQDPIGDKSTFFRVMTQSMTPHGASGSQWIDYKNQDCRSWCATAADTTLNNFIWTKTYCLNRTTCKRWFHFILFSNVCMPVNTILISTKSLPTPIVRSYLTRCWHIPGCYTDIFSEWKYTVGPNIGAQMIRNLWNKTSISVSIHTLSVFCQIYWSYLTGEDGI